MISERLKTLQFIVGPLIIGAALFAIISLFVSGVPKLTEFRLGTFGIIGTVSAVAGVALAFVVTRTMDRAAEDSLRASGTVTQIDEQLFERLQNRTIVGCALLEGGIFLNLVLNILQPHVLLLSLALGMLAVMSFYFPTSRRVQQWFALRREGITNRKTFD